MNMSSCTGKAHYLYYDSKKPCRLFCKYLSLQYKILQSTHLSKNLKQQVDKSSMGCIEYKENVAVYSCKSGKSQVKEKQLMHKVWTTYAKEEANCGT